MQFRTNFVSICVTQKRIRVKTFLIGSTPSLIPVVLSIPFTNKVTLLKIDYLAKLLLSINFDGKCICANRISTLHL